MANNVAIWRELVGYTAWLGLFYLGSIYITILILFLEKLQEIIMGFLKGCML